MKRGAPFVEQITGILRQISPKCNYEDIEKLILPLIVKYKASMHPRVIQKKIEQVINGIIKKFKKKDPSFITIFDGPSFPHEVEVD